MTFSKHIPTLYPYALKAEATGADYIRFRLWAQDQHLVYITDYIAWRGYMRFKDESMATMCKLSAGLL